MSKQMGMSLGYETYYKVNRAIVAQTQSLSMLVDNYEKRLLQIPEYQRQFVWDTWRKKQWSEAIKEHITIPTFFMYDIKGTGVYFLADGCQRLYTTLEILNSPDEYGFDSFEEVDYHLSMCQISVVKMSCSDHEEGYQHFVGLNSRGTILTPADVYKGKMVTNDPRALSNQIYANINGMVRERTASIIRLPSQKKKINLKYANLEIRDNLALLYQYLSKTDTREFWHVASMDVHDIIPVEQHLAQLLNSIPKGEIQTSIDDFLMFLSQSVELIKHCIDKKYEKSGYTLSPGLARHLLHFCIFSRNTKFPNMHKIAYIQAVINASLKGNARLTFVSGDGTIIDAITAHTDDLARVGIVCKIHNIPWGDALKRKKQNQVRAGLENSHYEPHSLFGEGETFPEPAPINRARGASLVESGENGHHE